MKKETRHSIRGSAFSETHSIGRSVSLLEKKQAGMVDGADVSDQEEECIYTTSDSEINEMTRYIGQRLKRRVSSNGKLPVQTCGISV
jgi:hypothetical protein